MDMVMEQLKKLEDGLQTAQGDMSLLVTQLTIVAKVCLAHGKYMQNTICRST